MGKKPVLTKTEKDKLRKASTTVVGAELSNMKHIFSRGKWINKTNKYRTNSLSSLKNPLNSQQMLQYLAASVPLHCSDGWKFLGQAISSLKYGDPYICCHLAYYAELRAAMSLLASQGVGVFSTTHVIAEASRICMKISPQGNRARGANSKAARGTHKFVWVALQHWGELQRSADLVGKVIRPHGISLEIWLSAYSPASIHPIAIKWLKTWGVDLKYLFDDQFLRNDSSYRPNHIANLPSNNSVNICSFMTSLWRLFEPSSSFEFTDIDNYLLRLSIEMQFEAITGGPPNSNLENYKLRVIQMLDRLAIDGAKKTYYERFLAREILPNDPAVILNSQKLGTTEDPEFHLQVLSRAALMLRLATGSVANCFSNNGINRSDISFWINSCGLSRGFWHPSMPPEDMRDLWDDVSDACDILESWNASVVTGGSDSSMLSFISGNNIEALSVVSGFERIALWGFCS